MSGRMLECCRLNVNRDLEFCWGCSDQILKFKSLFLLRRSYYAIVLQLCISFCMQIFLAQSINERKEASRISLHSISCYSPTHLLCSRVSFIFFNSLSYFIYHRSSAHSTWNLYLSFYSWLAFPHPSGFSTHANFFPDCQMQVHLPLLHLSSLSICCLLCICPILNFKFHKVITPVCVVQYHILTIIMWRYF